MVKNNKSGQVALIVLLIIVVVLTIGLSIAARSITDIRISQDEQESLRAFSAAEAGIEEILSQSSITLGTTPVTVDDGLSATVEVSAVNEMPVKNGEIFNIDLPDDNDTYSLSIYWTKKNDSTEDSSNCDSTGPAAVEIVVYKRDGTFTRSTYNAYACSLANNFADSAESDNPGFRSQVSPLAVDTTTDDLVRVRPYYKKATIKVTESTGKDVGAQVYKITSTALVEGNKTGKISVNRTIPSLLTIFDYALFSKGNLGN